MKLSSRLHRFAYFAVSIAVGFYAMSPGSVAHSNVDWVPVVLLLVAIPSFVVVSVACLVSQHKGLILRAPTWERFSFDWQHDPLQFFYEFAGSMAGVVLGGALRLPPSSVTGWWVFASLVAFFLGLVVGILLLHAFFRRRITKA